MPEPPANPDHRDRFTPRPETSTEAGAPPGFRRREGRRPAYRRTPERIGHPIRQREVTLADRDRLLTGAGLR